MAREQRNLERLTIKNAQILCRNFEGKEKKNTKGQVVNSEGSRNFLVRIPDTMDVDELLSRNWNVKPFGSDDPFYVIPVKVRFDKFPPKIVLVTGEGKKRQKTPIDEYDVKQLDTMEISNIDIIITQSYYNVRGTEGYCTYLKTMYVEPIEDELDELYADVMEDEIPFD